MNGATGAATPAADPESDRGFAQVFALWVLYLFEPARLISHYLPLLRPLKWLPLGLLTALFLVWLLSPRKKRHYEWLTAVMIVNLLGTVVAFMIGNWGIARLLNREMLQYYALALLTIDYCDSGAKVRRLSRLYLLSIAYYALLGVWYLKLSPVDPLGVRPIIPWHPWLDNRDAFGPLMTIGIGYSFHYYGTAQSRRLRWLCVSCFGLCAIGVVLSFGRGVFLAMVATALYLVFGMRRKLLAAVRVAAVGLVVAIFLSFSDVGALYWERIKGIKGAASEVGSGSDRIRLWGWALQEFATHPVLGVGTGNFGIAVLKLVDFEEASEAGYTTGRLWGRKLHSLPLQVLSEHGLVGVLVFAGLMLDFIRRNRACRNLARQCLDGPEDAGVAAPASSEMVLYDRLAAALMAAGIAFSVNSVFYEILYAPFLWHLLALNRVVHRNVLDAREGGR